MNSVLIRKYNLPFTRVVVWNNGKSVMLENVLVDTGSASTIFKLARVDEIDLVATEEDTFGSISGIGGKELIFYKTVEAIELNGIRIEGFEVDIGHMNYGNDFMIDGIIGMDLLQRLKANINIEELILTCKP
jgi:predicted aspartyl protease